VTTKTTGGLDEVGWGALAGPIISVVAVFDEESIVRIPKGVTDSKKLTHLRREGFYYDLCKAALDVGVGHAMAWEIDKLTPYVALQLSYSRALTDLALKPDILIVDGTNRVKTWTGNQRTEVKADSRFLEVSSASIIAKYLRDVWMEQLGKLYPVYKWGSNRGYGSEDHRKAIIKHGLLIGEGGTDYHHRKTYCKKIRARM